MKALTRRWWPGPSLMALALPALVLLGGCSLGNFELEDGDRHRGDISLTVGNIDIGRDCQVGGNVRLQAGNVTVGDRSLIEGTIVVKHGNVELADGVEAAAVTVTNGVIELGEQAAVAGVVSLTNGVIEIQGARVRGRVELVRGRLEIEGGSVLENGLWVENTGRALKDSTYVVIQAGARVAGEVHVSGYARLIVASGADVAAAEFTGLAPDFDR